MLRFVTTQQVCISHGLLDGFATGSGSFPWLGFAQLQVTHLLSWLFKFDQYCLSLPPSPSPWGV